MNTNSNAYTVIYTTIVVVAVAAILAFASMKLGPAQQANAKAETLRQMMAAAQVETTDNLYASKNAAVLQLYADNIEKAFTVNLDGDIIGELSTDKNSIELVSNLKPQNKAIKAGGDATLPVYVFKSGKLVIPIYGAGLWGPIWGYVAFENDLTTIAGVYFDHESETPGLGAKIKDEPWFREKFAGKKATFTEDPIFSVAKGVEATGVENGVDAITGATMTSKGLNEAIDVWLQAYKPFFGLVKALNCAEGCCGEDSCACGGKQDACTGDCSNCPGSGKCQSAGDKCSCNEKNTGCTGDCNNCGKNGGCQGGCCGNGAVEPSANNTK